MSEKGSDRTVFRRSDKPSSRFGLAEVCSRVHFSCYGEQTYTPRPSSRKTLFREFRSSKSRGLAVSGLGLRGLGAWDSGFGYRV